MKKVAVLLDGGFVLSNLYRLLDKRLPNALEVWEYAQACVRRADEELFRIYYYDCPPYEGSEMNPLSGEVIDFSRTRTSHQRSQLHEELSLMDWVAFRRGVLAFNGWRLNRKSMESIMTGRRAPVAADLEPDLEQKRVDIKIGLDVAWLASTCMVGFRHGVSSSGPSAGASDHSQLGIRCLCPGDRPLPRPGPFAAQSGDVGGADESGGMRVRGDTHVPRRRRAGRTSWTRTRRTATRWTSRRSRRRRPTTASGSSRSAAGGSPRPARRWSRP